VVTVLLKKLNLQWFPLPGSRPLQGKLLVETGADPWVTYYKGNYYYCYSIGDRLIAVNKAKRLEDIKQNKQVVWAAPKHDPLSEEVWAPELHRLDGKWYIYFTAGRAKAHRMYVLEGLSDDPQGEYRFKGKISDDTDRWAIDGTVVEINDKRYMVWSGWSGNTDGRQELYIAEMSNPWTITGKRSCIAEPEHDWEHVEVPPNLQGDNAVLPAYGINEGPQALVNGKKLYLIFSAGHTVTGDYCLGQLAYTGGDPLDKNSWVKASKPVFHKTDRIVSPGHASFIKQGRHNWIIYHSSKYEGSGWDRQVLAQKFRWNEDGTPNFGRPLLPS
jgi:GH43 family beta-xylosidase